MRTARPWLLAGLLLVSPLAAAEPGMDDAVQLRWRVDFGGTASGSLVDRLALTLAAPGPAGPVEAPLLVRDYTLAQNDGEGTAESTPWGNRRILWWVVSGIGVAALIASASRGDDPPAPAGTGGSN